MNAIKHMLANQAIPRVIGSNRLGSRVFDNLSLSSSCDIVTKSLPWFIIRSKELNALASFTSIKKKGEIKVGYQAFIRYYIMEHLSLEASLGFNTVFFRVTTALFVLSSLCCIDGAIVIMLP